MDANRIENVAPVGMPLNVVHPEYASLTPDQVRDIAFAKLEKHIADGQKAAARALDTIMNTEIVDRVLPARAARFERFQGGLALKVGDAAYDVADHALMQASGRLGLQTRTLRDFIGRGEWGQDLAAHTLNELAAHAPENERYLVRRVGNDVRGVLSSSYAPEDSRPAIDALLGLAPQMGAVVSGCTALDTKVSLKLVLAKPVEIFPGEWCVMGADYRTSDFGDGARELCGWILRLLCINGATVTTNFRKVHIGRRLSDDINYSDRTRRLNNQASASAARDMGRALLGPAQVQKYIEQVRANHAAGISPDAIKAELKKAVGKEDETAIIEAFNSPDVQMMPAGQNRWRFSNAISFIAGQKEDARARLDLERLAGDVLVAA